MKYEVFLAHYFSVVVEAENEGAAEMKVADMENEEIMKILYSDSAFQVDYAEEFTGE